MQQSIFSFSQSLAEATGPIDYTFTNDYMFRAILQENTEVLKALICSMLHISPEQVKSVEITNPIVLGQHIDNKEYVFFFSFLANRIIYSTTNLQYQ